MQTYHLIVDPEGRVTIPNARPGQAVTVQVEPQPATIVPDRLTLATATTPEERAAVIAELKRIAHDLHEELRDTPPFTVEDLYGEDGLPA